jgi:quercetin dioxygenase-like cupin family protein
MKHADLQTFLEDMAGLPRTTTLFHEGGLRGLLLHVKPGEQIPEHETPGAISVHCLKGEAIFSSGDAEVTLRSASLISLAPAKPHSLIARQDTLLLITIAEQRRDKPA